MQSGPQQTAVSLAVCPRNNLVQWEKVIRGEENTSWLATPPAAPGPSEKQPVKTDE